jgi:hypothetical protein
MNEIFKDAFYISGTMCFVTVTIGAWKSMAVLKALFLSGPAPSEPVGIAPLPNGVMEQNDSVFEVPELTDMPEPLTSLECGHCHNEIKTAPVNVEGRPPFEKVIYRCEHCGTEVGIPS